MNEVPAAGKHALGPPQKGDLIRELLENRRHPAVAQVLRNPETHRLQILYVVIDRDGNNRPSFSFHDYRLNAAEYFYPASTVKLPLALAALEKIHTLAVPGLDADTPFRAWPGAGSAEMETTVNHAVREIFRISDNASANLLYDFLGQDELHAVLRRKGYALTEIRHRLDVALPSARNRITGPVRFFRDGKELCMLPETTGHFPFAARTDFIGGVHVEEDRTVPGPMDFSAKNRAPLEELVRMLRTVIFPETADPAERFRLSEEDFRHLYQTMGGCAPEQDAPPPERVKFLLLGGAPPAPAHAGVRIYNKSGWAYGFLSDIAYVTDARYGVEFLLGATLYTDPDGIPGSGSYGYDTVGKPFLAELGKAIYAWERARPRKYLPDLGRYIGSRP